MSIQPTHNGSIGRDHAGRFAKGNRGGPGCPYAQAVAHLRGELLRAVTDADVAKVVAKLIDAAKAGEPWAMKEFLDRTLGKARQEPELDTNDSEPMQLVIRVSPEAGQRMRAQGQDVGEWENRAGL